MRPRRMIDHLAVAVITASFSTQLFAVNALFAARGPLGHLKKEDVTIARAVIVQALDAGQDGQTQTWSNPKTKASGTVKPTRTYEKDGMRCRVAEFTTSAGPERGASTWNLCNTKEGWKIAQ
jgi:surface antigen